MKEIIHIVGLNNEYKDQFITNIKNIDPNYNIIDIDVLTEQITNSTKLSKLCEDYDKFKNDKNKSKQIANDINIEWSRDLQSKLNKLLSISNNSSIVIGLTTSIINTGVPKIHITLPTNYKFIIDIDLIDNAKQIIKNNLKEYKNQIINGKFSLDYLNLDFLVKRREQLNSIYIKNLYISKKIDDVLLFFKEYINKDKIKEKKLYFASNQEFIKYIGTKNLSLYNNDILSMLQMFKLANFQYDSTNKIIKELSKDSLNELQKDCFIYEITELDDVFFDGENFKNNKKLKINKSTYIECIYDILIKYGVKFVKFK
jgi:hypothetical protein